MGKAPRILDELRLTREELQEHERQWELDTATGELKPEEVPSEDPQTRPQPVRVARQTFD